MKQVSSAKSFGGTQAVYAHQSAVNNCDMRFGVYTPPEDVHGAGPYPTLWWLSGLTCTEDNFIIKSGAQRIASELGIMIVNPDTSPRGEGVPDDPEGAYDFGLAAGFYVNATQEPWSKHYHMYDYVTEELRALAEKELPVDPARTGIFGHSMGGHGSLTLHLKNPEIYKTCSAFAPISAPSQTPWGRKAFSNYLGPDEAAWVEYDATQLVAARPSNAEIFIDQGDADAYLQEELRPDLFAKAAAQSGQKLTLKMREGYDHSFFFISTFLEEHMRWHLERLSG
ncbi:MAG: S-formylglutathione hydrolase [Pseudomonadota bacterium]